jgi:hypothetical protein
MTTASAYELEGTILEACTCDVLCPCWIGEDPDGGTCDAVIAYHIERGRIGDIDVSGLTLASAAHIPGNVLEGNWTLVHFVDERATPEQMQALLDAFDGRHGGPLADLAQLHGDVLGVYQVPIQYEIVDGEGTLAVDGKVKTSMAPYRSAFGTTSTLRDSVFSTIPGSPAWVSKASETALTIPEHGIAWRVEGRNAIQGEFRFEA